MPEGTWVCLETAVEKNDDNIAISEERYARAKMDSDHGAMAYAASKLAMLHAANRELYANVVDWETDDRELEFVPLVDAA